MVTSGLGGYYPKGIRIGEVTSVQSDDVKVMKTAILKHMLILIIYKNYL